MAKRRHAACRLSHTRLSALTHSAAKHLLSGWAAQGGGAEFQWQQVRTMTSPVGWTGHRQERPEAWSLDNRPSLLRQELQETLTRTLHEAAQPHRQRGQCLQAESKPVLTVNTRETRRAHLDPGLSQVSVGSRDVLGPVVREAGTAFLVPVLRSRQRRLCQGLRGRPQGGRGIRGA